jgi:hypothetical protein
LEDLWSDAASTEYANLDWCKIMQVEVIQNEQIPSIEHYR